MAFCDLAQTVLLRRDFFMVVEHEGEIVFRILEIRREIQHHRIRGFHIGGTPPPHHPFARVCGGDVLADQRIARFQPARREIVDYRDRVQMPGEDHPAFPAQIRGRDHGIAMPPHRQMRLAGQERLNLVSQRAFIVADRIPVHDISEHPLDFGTHPLGFAVVSTVIRHCHVILRQSGKANREDRHARLATHAIANTRLFRHVSSSQRSWIPARNVSDSRFQCVYGCPAGDARDTRPWTRATPQRRILESRRTPEGHRRR